MVLEATVGSRAWGLADAASDTDVRGVFALPLPWSLGLAEAPTDLVSQDGSTTFWELGKAVRQALRADPNTLEMLFVDSVQATDPIGAWLLEARDAFVSRDIYGSFGRYALAQLKRLGQSLRLAEHREVVLTWLREDPIPSLDVVAGRLAKSVTGARSEAQRVLQAKEYVKQLYGSLHDQGLIAASDFRSLVRLARESGHAFELPRTLRPKNAYNLLRLLRVAIDWLATGSPRLSVEPGPFRDRLLAIKGGEVPLHDVLAEADAMLPELEAARRVSRLPARPDLARADAFLRRAGIELARRHVHAEPGPFGPSAPLPFPPDAREADDEPAHAASEDRL